MGFATALFETQTTLPSKCSVSHRLLTVISFTKGQKHRGIEQVLLGSRAQATACTFTGAPLRDSHLQNRAQKPVNFCAVTGHTSRADVPKRQSSQLKLRKKGLTTEKTPLKTIKVPCAGCLTVQAERTTECDILRCDNARLEQERQQLQVSFDDVLHLQEEAIADLNEERTKSDQLEREIARLQEENKAILANHLVELAALHDRLDAVVFERDSLAATSTRTAATLTNALAKAEEELCRRETQLAAQQTAYRELEHAMDVKKQKYDAFWRQADDCVREANRVAEEKEAKLVEVRETVKDKDELIAMLHEHIERLQLATDETPCTTPTPIHPREVLFAPPLTPPSPSPAPFFINNPQLQLQCSPSLSPGADEPSITDRYRPMLLAGVLLRQAFRACKVPTPPAAGKDIASFARVLPRPVSPKYCYSRRDGGRCGIPRPRAGRVVVDHDAPLVPREPRLVARPGSSRIPIRFDVF
ncbi:hypothetical protein OF83DRAFT_99859 [Amylostereum chailletii]|nr:hypothetical protein OF83DRAFT_99859 [Amylostereum chailletii]